MCDYNERMLKAKQNLEQRLTLQTNRREDGEKYAASYFSVYGEEIVKEILDYLVEYIEDEYNSETYFETTYIIRINEYFLKSDAYRDGFKEKMVEFVSKNICDMIPDFKNNLDVIINEQYEMDNRIHIIVSLKF